MNPKRALVAGRTGPRIVTGANALIQLLLLAAALVACALRTTGAILGALQLATTASLCLALSILSVIDVRTRTLPRRIVRPMYAGGLAHVLLAAQAAGCADAGVLAIQAVSSLAVGAAAAGVVLLLAHAMERVQGHRRTRASAGGGEAPAAAAATPPMGAGDMRLICALGIALGTDLLPVLLVACLAACAYALAFRRASFPFGPFLAAPAMALLCAGACLGLP